MPHKHKRKLKDDKDFNLPPTKRARALPVGKQAGGSAPLHLSDAFLSKAKRRQQAKADGRDAARAAARRADPDGVPREFARLMRLAAGQSAGSMLDNGDARPGPKKANKKENKKDEDGKAGRKAPAQQKPKQGQNRNQTPAQQKLKILPGEKLSDFSARVNQSIPVSGMASKAKKVDGIVEHVPRHVRKLQRRQEHYVREDARQRAARARDLDDLDDLHDRTVDEYGDVFATMAEAVEGARGKTERVRRRKRAARGDDDPWEVLKERRREAERAGLHDVVHAPPQFTVVPTVKLRSKQDRRDEQRRALVLAAAAAAAAAKGEGGGS